MGRPYAESLRGKFTNIGHVFEPVLYVAEFTNGVVKVGFTQNPRTRLASLQTLGRKYFGEVVINRFHITNALESSSRARVLEKVALTAITAKAKRAHLYDAEYFTGISFENAVETVEQVVHAPQSAFFCPSRVLNPVQRP